MRGRDASGRRPSQSLKIMKTRRGAPSAQRRGGRGRGVDGNADDGGAGGFEPAAASAHGMRRRATSLKISSHRELVGQLALVGLAIEEEDELEDDGIELIGSMNTETGQGQGTGKSKERGTGRGRGRGKAGGSRFKATRSSSFGDGGGDEATGTLFAGTGNKTKGGRSGRRRRGGRRGAGDANAVVPFDGDDGDW